MSCVQLRYEIRFGQLSITHPSHSESDDNQVTELYPAQARHRNLTYEAGLFVEVQKSAFNAKTDEPEGEPVTTL